MDLTFDQYLEYIPHMSEEELLELSGMDNPTFQEAFEYYLKKQGYEHHGHGFHGTFESLPDYSILDILKSADDNTLLRMCVFPLSKKIQKVCKMDPDLVKRINSIKPIKKKRGNTILWLNPITGKLDNPFGPAQIEYYRNTGKVKTERWVRNDIITRDYRPAEISYYNDDNHSIKREEYYRNGILNREDGPASIQYYSNGNIESEVWRKDGLVTRDDGPASIYYYENGIPNTEIWLKDDEFHRDDGPSVIERDKKGNITLQKWYKNGKAVVK